MLQCICIFICKLVYLNIQSCTVFCITLDVVLCQSELRKPFNFVIFNHFSVNLHPENWRIAFKLHSLLSDFDKIPHNDDEKYLCDMSSYTGGDTGTAAVCMLQRVHLLKSHVEIALYSDSNCPGKFCGLKKEKVDPLKRDTTHYG